MKTAYEVRCDHVAKFHRIAENAFKDHSIATLHEDGVYRHLTCSRENSCIYRFHVVTFPGYLVVAGDIGEMMWLRCEDMFTWAPGAIKSIDYFEEKVPHGITTKEFDADVARAALHEQISDEMMEENPELWCQRKDQILDCEWLVDEDEHNFMSEVYNSGLFDGEDWPDFTVWNSTFLWCREALLWFFKKRGMMP